jgi:hypothetical protein
MVFINFSCLDQGYACPANSKAAKKQGPRLTAALFRFNFSCAVRRRSWDAAARIRPGGFSPTLRRAGRVNGLVLAVADGADAHRVNAQFGQRLAQRQRAAFAERAVVFLRAAFVAIAFDEQLRARVRAQRGGNGLKIRLLAVSYGGAVVGKMNRVRRPARHGLRSSCLQISPSRSPV